MKWPLCWRAELEASEARLRWTEEQLRTMEGKLAAQAATTDHLLKIANDGMAYERERREEVERKLFDRIVEMSGQPAIFEKQAPPIATETKSDAAPPAIQVSFDDVHKAARAAMAKGDFKVPRGRLN